MTLSTLTRIPVESSTIAAIGHDESTQTLAVEFVNGSVYSFADVPSETAIEFVNADSKGKYFAAEIRGEYDSTRIE